MTEISNKIGDEVRRLVLNKVESKIYSSSIKLADDVLADIHDGICDILVDSIPGPINDINNLK